MDKLRECAKVLEEFQLNKVVYEEAGLKIELERGGGAQQLLPQPVASPAPKVQAEETVREENLVRSPLAGVFYAKPDPESEDYVKLGDEVKAGQILCLVETMKIMNEIKAPGNGIIRRIAKSSGDLVEYDEVLFEVDYE